MNPIKAPISMVNLRPSMSPKYPPTIENTIETTAIAPKINPTSIMGIFRLIVKNIARNGHVAPIPKDLIDEAKEATQKFLS